VVAKAAERTTRTVEERMMFKEMIKGLFKERVVACKERRLGRGGMEYARQVYITEADIRMCE